MDAMEQFTQQYSQFTQKQVVEITCRKCLKETSLLKERAGENVKRNNGFVCRSCRMSEVNPDRVWTERGRQAVAEAARRPRSAETRKKMSESRKKFFQTPAGQEHKLARSREVALGHSQNKYEKAKLHGWHYSPKLARYVFFGSSYELRLCWLLDQDTTVVDYRTQVSFETSNGRGRCIDCVVTYDNGIKSVIEVKPQTRLDEQSVIEQIADSAAYANSLGWHFKVVTETDLGLTATQIREWADQFLLETVGIDLKQVRKKAWREKAKRHYDNKIATDKVEVVCPFCNEVHSVLAKSHKANVARNGRYICEREGGHIAGSKPKLALRKENLYAAEGKKECVLCKEVKPFDQFGVDKSRRDGCSSRCLECRARVAKEKYQQTSG